MRDRYDNKVIRDLGLYVPGDGPVGTIKKGIVNLQQSIADLDQWVGELTAERDDLMREKLLIGKQRQELVEALEKAEVQLQLLEKGEQ